MDKCEECGGTKDAYNTEKEEYRCSNRSCPKSPMNDYLTYKGTHIGDKQ